MDHALLQAPLEHVKRQFRQNCLFQFDGAIFLSTPTLMTEIRSALGVENWDTILLSAAGDPVVLKAARLPDLLNTASQVLSTATSVFVTQKAQCDAEFEKRLALTPLPDEETE